ncbi:MAG: SDR family oxidoreductase [Allosphingosinicella sp.]|uniref:SDR family oxidoreductase n=1 Tax=Allosphingosinicella sp. TaxID=2823234 RepID=UPI00394B6E18
MTDLSRRQILTGGAAAAITVAAAPAAAAAVQADEGAGAPDLRGKTILVTGTSSGFGRIGSLLYARAGARVIATMRGLPRPEAEELREAARAERLDLHVVEIDVLDDASVARGVAEAERIAGGGIDVLVNNAGIGLSGPVELQDMEATKLVFDTNVYGYHRMARAVLPGMRAKGPGGVIFNVSSQLGRVIAPNIGHYSATKFAVEAMSEQMAYELAPRGIEVVIIQPGGYPTRIWESGARRTAALMERVEEARKAGYPELMQGAVRSGGGSTDPADVPRAIAEIIAMPAGRRPLRRAVHPGARPQEPINEVSARVQREMLGRGPFAPWAEAVLG